jgi:hypothetical protein
VKHISLTKYIDELIEKQGRNKNWVAAQARINYKTFVGKLNNNRAITGEEMLKMSKRKGWRVDVYRCENKEFYTSEKFTDWNDAKQYAKRMEGLEPLSDDKYLVKTDRYGESETMFRCTIDPLNP